MERQGRRQQRSWASVLEDRRGVAALELGILLPVLLMVLVGIVQAGVLYNNFIELNNAVRVASRVFAASRGSATPLSSATSNANASAPNLTSISWTFSVAGTSCGTDAACGSALTAAAGGTAGVAATYPCDLTILGVNYAPGCTLSSQTAERIE